jgi:cytochrome c553
VRATTWGCAGLALAAVLTGGPVAAAVLAAAAATLAWRTQRDQAHARDAWTVACHDVAAQAGPQGASPRLAGASVQERGA